MAAVSQVEDIEAAQSPSSNHVDDVLQVQTVNQVADDPAQNKEPGRT
jgi:hypothetical protein